MPIEVSVTDQNVEVSTSGQTVNATVSGGVGPAGAKGDPGTTAWAGITDKPATFAPSTHAASHGSAGSDPVTVAVSQVSGLQAALDAKSPAAHTHLTNEISDASNGNPVAPVIDPMATRYANDGWPGIRQYVIGAAALSHTHAISNVTGLQAALDAKQASGSYATLDGSGKVPAAQLPSYVDDVLEYANLAAFPATGATGTIYVAIDTAKAYRWTGSTYLEISPSEVTSVAGKTGAVTLAKADVGLGNVDNTSDASKPVSSAQQAALNLKANLSGATFTGNVTAPNFVGDLDGHASSAGYVHWGNVDNTPTTRAGYGITDAAASSHAHGNVTNAGAIGSTSGLPIVTGTGGVLQAGAFGTGAGQVCQGNDSRLSDSRTPTAHKSTHATGGSDALTAADIGAAASSHAHAASDITSGTIATARLGSGTADASTFLRGDQTYAAVSAANVSGLAASATTDTTSATNITAGTLAAARIGTHATTHNPGGSDAVTLVEVYEFTPTTKPASATGSGGIYTWTIPSAAKWVHVRAISGGGGGGSGRRGANGSARAGGGGGGGGGVTEWEFPATDPSSRTLSLSVGAGGAGGAAATADDTNGNAGSNGGPCTVYTSGGSGILVSGGFGGSAGGTGTSAGGATSAFGSDATYQSSAGGAGNVATGGNAIGTLVGGCGGGGGGGGLSTGDASSPGGNGGAGAGRLNFASITTGTGRGSPGAANGGAGGSAAAPAGLIYPHGSGGGGGGSNGSGAGGSGGNGLRGGGGGGGGASANGNNSGAGGNGGDGFVRITVWY